MNTVKINGVIIQATRSIVVSGGKVFVDGKDVTPEGKDITISVVGNIENLEVDACSKLTVTGDVATLKTASGDVEVTGNVRQMCSQDIMHIDPFYRVTTKGHIEPCLEKLSCEDTILVFLQCSDIWKAIGSYMFFWVCRLWA